MAENVLAFAALTCYNVKRSVGTPFAFGRERRDEVPGRGPPDELQIGDPLAVGALRLRLGRGLAADRIIGAARPLSSGRLCGLIPATRLKPSLGLPRASQA